MPRLQSSASATAVRPFPGPGPAAWSWSSQGTASAPSSHWPLSVYGIIFYHPRLFSFVCLPALGCGCCPGLKPMSCRRAPSLTVVLPRCRRRPHDGGSRRREGPRQVPRMEFGASEQASSELQERGCVGGVREGAARCGSDWKHSHEYRGSSHFAQCTECAGAVGFCPTAGTEGAISPRPCGLQGAREP